MNVDSILELFHEVFGPFAISNIVPVNATIQSVQNKIFDTDDPDIGIAAYNNIPDFGNITCQFVAHYLNEETKLFGNPVFPFLFEPYSGQLSFYPSQLRSNEVNITANIFPEGVYFKGMPADNNEIVSGHLPQPCKEEHFPFEIILLGFYALYSAIHGFIIQSKFTLSFSITSGLFLACV